ncbi:MAG: hypothetical protein WA771_05060 [Chthoniobacterales bacterium]
MLLRILGLIVGLSLVSGDVTQAADSRGELLFTASAALKTGDRGYFERCFEFDGSDPEARGQVKAIIDEILRWENPIVTSTERQVGNAEGGPEMNGKWRFQVHFANGPGGRQAFVFPAGPSEDGEVKILLVAGG